MVKQQVGRKWTARKGLAALAAVLISAMLAACAKGGGGESTGSGGTSPGASSEAAKKPFVMTMVDQFSQNQPPAEDDPFVQKIRDFTGTDLKMTWIPGGNVNEKINAIIASGDMPKALIVFENKSTTLMNAVRSGVFWEIGPYIDEFPNLKKYLDPQVLDGVKIDGKLYSLPRSRPLIGDGVILRQDWLDNLGLKQPTTIDELYNVIKAFTLDDPDKDGKNDTIGLVDESTLRGFGFVQALFDAPNGWELKDGKLSPAQFNPGYLEALKFYRKLYQEGLMNKEFSLQSRSQAHDLLNKGQGGLLIGDPDMIVGLNADKVDPKAKYTTFVKMKSKDGTERVLMSNGYTGNFFFPKSAIKDEAELKQVLGFFDKLSAPEMQTLFTWGIEGTHYTLKDGKATVSPEQAANNAVVNNRRNELAVVDSLQASIPGERNPIDQLWISAKQEMNDKVVTNPAANLISKTQAERGTELDQILQDARVKFIIGEIDEAGWDAEMKKWRSSGGDQVIEETNELYQKMPK
ncbi:extracellular solute-binding protein [Paenibacillus humicola]|uniref:extracellular solute-binding protein n=1 Tax=Paenibacillus humicola TaxID=3110540 RepID=UPI00237AD090|nr:extracellular solute-binding protein [Paenibacillus humicola]